MPMKTRKTGKDLLLWILLLSVFMNGFEAAGYQTSLISVGKEFALDGTGMGLFASVQLIAGLIAPLVFGSFADQAGKKKSLTAFFMAEIVGSLTLVLGKGYFSFIAGVFIIGLSVSAVQLTSIAAIADLFPVSGNKKIGIVTGCYSAGAVVAPLICGFYLDRGYSWRLLFLILLIVGAAEITAVSVSDFTPREVSVTESREETTGAFAAVGILLLCVIMFVYVGFENGYAFFINSFITETLKGSHSYLALSLFWLAMIPSRLLCGCYSRYNKQILVLVSTGAAVTAFLISVSGTGNTVTLLSALLGFFCGAVYPSVLTRSLDFAGKKTATVTGMITAATGLGGAAVTVVTGVISKNFGLRASIKTLAIIIAADVFVSLLLLNRRYGRHTTTGTER